MFPVGQGFSQISEMGVQMYKFGVNWVSNSFSFHSIIHKNMDIRVSKRHPDTPLAKGMR